MTRIRHRIYRLVALGLCVAFGEQVGAASEFVVDSTADTIDAAPGDGVCADAIGQCTLRAAIQETNALAGADTIMLPAGEYPLTIPGQGEDESGEGDLDITDDLVLVGAGAATTIIDGNELDRVLDIPISASSLTVTILGVTLQHGVADSFASGFGGGGIRNRATLSLTGVDVVDCVVIDGGGGGIYNEDGLLSLDHCMVSGNFAEGGAGIYNFSGTVTVTDSRIIGNIANVPFIIGQGGGIRSYYEKHRVTVARTLIADNVSSAAGSGIYMGSGDGNLSLIDSTVSGNVAGGAGGGIFVLGSSNSASLINVTVTGNTADSDEFFSFGDGGGVYTSLYSGTFTVKNVIISGNLDMTGEAHDCAGQLASQGYNLVEDPIGCTMTGDLTGNILGEAPLLGPLADNGGPTWTHALLPRSPAIDSGDPDDCPPTDQRGFPRPTDGDDDGVARCDMGAFEVQCAVSIVSSDPADGAIDARQPSQPDGSKTMGWDAIDLLFSAEVGELTVEDFTVSTNPPGPTPIVINVTADGEIVTVELDSFIPTGAWTTITHTCSATHTRIGYLPADVNNDKLSNANDVLYLIDVLNGVIDPTPPAYQTDTDRSGATNANDVLRVIDLLNGAGMYDEYLGASLPD